jgi:fatty acid desaturase
MGIYWLPSHIPELKGIPKEMRDEIVEEALHSIPITSTNLLSFVAVMIPITASGLAFHVAYGWPWVKFVYLVVGFPFFWVWWLNVARPRIREIANEKAREQEDRHSVDA